MIIFLMDLDSDTEPITFVDDVGWPEPHGLVHSKGHVAAQRRVIKVGGKAFDDAGFEWIAHCGCPKLPAQAGASDRRVELGTGPRKETQLMSEPVVRIKRRFTERVRRAGPAVAETDLAVIGLLCPCLGAES